MENTFSKCRTRKTSSKPVFIQQPHISYQCQHGHNLSYQCQHGHNSQLTMSTRTQALKRSMPNQWAQSSQLSISTMDTSS